MNVYQLFKRSISTTTTLYQQALSNNLRLALPALSHLVCSLQVHFWAQPRLTTYWMAFQQSFVLNFLLTNATIILFSQSLTSLCLFLVICEIEQTLRKPARCLIVMEVAIISKTWRKQANVPPWWDNRATNSHSFDQHFTSQSAFFCVILMLRIPASQSVISQMYLWMFASYSNGQPFSPFHQLY